MSRWLAVVFYALVLNFAVDFGVDGFSVNVPSTRSICRSMTPGHKLDPQRGAAPFQVTTNTKSVKGGDTVQVTLSGGQAFKGFYVQARDSNGSPIGTFSGHETAKTHNCGGIKDNAVHHVSPDPKNKMQVTWTAPSGYRGQVQIQATMVKDFNTFWTQIKPDPITVG